MRRTASLAVTALVLAACSSAAREQGANESVTPAPTPAVAPPTSAATTISAEGGGPPASSTPPAASSTPPPTAAPPSAAPLAGGEVRLEKLAGLNEPIALTWRAAEPETIYVAEQNGRIHRLDRRTGEGSEILDLTKMTRASGEQGLLGIAFDPHGEQLYVSYTNLDGNSRIDGYGVVDDGTVDTESRRQVLALDQPFPNHNGGNVVFGPDGYLYAGFGDGGAGGDPQRNGENPAVLLGKMLRIDPSAPSGDLGYTIPADNPFAGVAGARPELWSIGLRNPWRFSFDRATGDLWIGDVGQDRWEEIDLAPAADGAGRGADFGWSAFEGTHRYNDDQPTTGSQQMPLTEYPHDAGRCSVTGGYVYRGSAIPALAGTYVYGDYCAGTIWGLQRLAGGELHQVELGKVRTISSFGEDADGELYVLSSGDGLLRIVAAR